MEYPHKRYIQFLISKRLEEYEIVAECTAHGLVPPNHDDINDLKRELGIAPNWSARIETAQPDFKRWLRQNDLYDMWAPDATMRGAQDVLTAPHLRRCFESMMLLHGDVEVARAELINSHPSPRIPSLESLEMYCFYYWDISSISKNGLFEHLKASQENDAKIAAYQGELSITYGMLGMRQRISTLNMHDRLIQLADTQCELALRHGVLLNGNQLAGLAAISRSAQDAAIMRDDLNKASGDSSLRRDAAMFRARVVTPQRLIPSVDDLRLEVIDADFSEETGTGGEAIIHRFPTRREPQ